MLQCHVNKEILPSLNLPKKQIGQQQASRWLHQLGYCRKRHSKGIYWDGHEREDVKKAWVMFLDLLKEIDQWVHCTAGIFKSLNYLLDFLQYTLGPILSLSCHLWQKERVSMSESIMLNVLPTAMSIHGPSGSKTMKQSSKRKVKVTL